MQSGDEDFVGILRVCMVPVRTMKSPNLTVVNDMLREVYVNGISPKKIKNDHPQGYRSDASMTTTTAKLCRNCKGKGHSANKCPASKPLPGDTTAKWGSLHKTRSHSKQWVQGSTGYTLANPSITSLCFCVSSEYCPCCRDLFVAFMASSPPSRRKGYSYRPTTAAIPYGRPHDTPNAEQHLREH